MRERPSSAELSSFFSCRSGVYWKNFHEVKKTKKKRDEKVEDQRAIGTVSLNCLSQYQITTDLFLYDKRLKLPAISI